MRPVVMSITMCASSPKPSPSALSTASPASVEQAITWEGKEATSRAFCISRAQQGMCHRVEPGGTALAVEAGFQPTALQIGVENGKFKERIPAPGTRAADVGSPQG